MVNSHFYLLVYLFRLVRIKWGNAFFANLFHLRSLFWKRFFFNFVIFRGDQRTYVETFSRCFFFFFLYYSEMWLLYKWQPRGAEGVLHCPSAWLYRWLPLFFHAPFFSWIPGSTASRRSHGPGGCKKPICVSVWVGWHFFLLAAHTHIHPVGHVWTASAGGEIHTQTI